MKIAIIGGGISGLSCAICLQQAGFSPTLYSDKWTPNTTSDVAAAVWYPFTVEPEEKVAVWGKKSYEIFFDIGEESPESGVYFLPGYDLFGLKMPEQWWQHFVKDFRRLSGDEIPSGYVDGFSFLTPIIDMHYYMPWLEKRFLDGGGKKITQKISHIEDVKADIVINCAGLGSRELVNDKEVYPLKGLILKVHAPQIREFRHDFKNGPNCLSYIIPRKDNCVLGGTTEATDDLSVDMEAAKAIQRRCANLNPSLENAEILKYETGLRPARKEVRLEIDHSFSVPVVHNYGHGGAGVTISWGCAKEVLDHVNSLVKK
ncbi:FAD-dependent oxidoreductase [Candidatus Uabimicrobium amorphum]|uniref:D-amino-acid oxidase n=1 Tax=Uabimicrobium amorphum TaxID=2596890 RepID=A0A5S9F1Z8_UABAM|nr:FAD-dependent oxidoreductase [Candidatus Uabimicrobium amorphum]BBM82593.1 amino acid oxidase [Candidatus Uabimicrobium amorphum]